MMPVSFHEKGGVKEVGGDGREKGWKAVVVNGDVGICDVWRA
jgi:hypothetical protein